jgi:16S rRNA (cytosine967-C5)-methyltransferase
LAAWLKQFFSEHKKYGSKDRKTISHICYCWYRLGNALRQLGNEERMLTAVLLCSDSFQIVLRELKPEWDELVSLPLNEKLAHLSLQNEIEPIFPFKEEVSEHIDSGQFIPSLLLQPDLFLRIRPGQKERVIEQLAKANINAELINDDVLRLPNGSKIEDTLSIDEEVVVQDYSSQQVMQLLEPFMAEMQRPAVWDCCAASGGKSLLFYDRFYKTQPQLTVSDVRESIMHNLQNRFRRAGIKQYQSFVADLSSNPVPSKKGYDIIICDAPCSGSGTWGRTPEQLCFFKKEKIDYYSSLQKRIAENAARSLKPKGYFLYITCSVFKKENEEVVAYLQRNTFLQLRSSSYFKGYNNRADTLFAAVFTIE